MDAALLREGIDEFLHRSRRPLLIVVGPTASGKTALAIDLAVALGAEVVNADSRQLYRLLDIGTAKPTAEDMRGVPHHLLDTLDPKEEVTVGRYQVMASEAIDSVLARGRMPMLVGGSMLYVASITDGLSLAPAPTPGLRASLETEYDRDGGKSLYRRLQSVDPHAATAIHQRNKVHVVRALEISESLKQPKTVAVPRTELRSGAGEQKNCSYECFLIGVLRPRNELLKRIEERTDQMFAAGWIEEVRGLLDRGYEPSDPGMRSHGYREICQFLKESEDAEGAEDSEDMLRRLKHRIVVKTRQYAKRQMTWWRSDSRIHWMQADELACRLPRQARDRLRTGKG